MKPIEQTAVEAGFEYLDGMVMLDEEKLIKGIWSYRSAPDGDFIPFTIEKLSAKYVELKRINFYTESLLNAAAEEIERLKSVLTQHEPSKAD